MAYTFVFTKLAQKQVAKLDMVIRRRVAKKLQQLATYEDLSKIAVSLDGEFLGQKRIRIGQYRLICLIEKDVTTILRVEHRRDVYR